MTRLVWELVCLAFVSSLLELAGFSLVLIVVAVVAVVGGMVHGRRTEQS